MGSLRDDPEVALLGRVVTGLGALALLAFLGSTLLRELEV